MIEVVIVIKRKKKREKRGNKKKIKLFIKFFFTNSIVSFNKIL